MVHIASICTVHSVTSYKLMGALMSRTILSSFFLGMLQQELVKELSIRIKVHQQGLTSLYLPKSLCYHFLFIPFPFFCHLFLTYQFSHMYHHLLHMYQTPNTARLKNAKLHRPTQTRFRIETSFAEPVHSSGSLLSARM